MKFLLPLIILATCLSAQDATSPFDESALFGGNVEVSNVPDSSTNEEKNAGVSFGGSIYNESSYPFRRDVLLHNVNWKSNRPSTYLRGDFLIDARTDKGFKAYLGGLLDYKPGVRQLGGFENPPPAWAIMPSNWPAETNKVQFTLNEFFVDFNINRAVYIRAGKQLVKWGRGWFWNPTDLVNIDRKTFTDMNRSREGVNAIRLHIPVQAKANFYVFLRAADPARFEDYTYSLKAEAVAGKSEWALSAWLAKDSHPVACIDGSFPLGKWNIAMEGSVSKRGNQEHFKKTGTFLMLNPFTSNFIDAPKIDSNRIEWPVKAALSFNRSFKEDKITAGGEVYYNGEGYSRIDFKDKDLAWHLILNGAYQPLNVNRIYAAVFFSWTQLFKNTTTFSANAAVNCEDGSLILSPSFDFSPAQNFSISLNIPLYLAVDDVREFSFFNRVTEPSLRISVRF